MLPLENPVHPAEKTTDPAVSSPPRPEVGIVELIQQLLDDIVTWILLEGDLARAEVAEKTKTALRGLVIGATGVVIFVCGGIAILLAIGFAASGVLERAGIDPAFSHALGFLLSGLVGAIAGWIVMHQAKTILSPANLTPSRTTETLRRALQWAGAKLHLHPHDDHEQNTPSP